MACAIEIWREFQTRFGIPRIVEFYGATEGNVSMLNYDGTVGAVGRRARLSGMAAAVAGHSLRCRNRDAGARARTALHRVRRGRSGRDDRRHSRRARAAASRATATRPTATRKCCATSLKRAILVPPGDLMRRDGHGYFYFVDRVGDTFRWKGGKNVSTGEVGAALARAPAYWKPMPMAWPCWALGAPAWHRWW